MQKEYIESWPLLTQNIRAELLNVFHSLKIEFERNSVIIHLLNELIIEVL